MVKGTSSRETENGPVEADLLGGSDVFEDEKRRLRRSVAATPVEDTGEIVAGAQGQEGDGW